MLFKPGTMVYHAGKDLYGLVDDETRMPKYFEKPSDTFAVRFVSLAGKKVFASASNLETVTSKEQIQTIHRRRLEHDKLTYHGFQAATPKSHKKAKCWQCHRPLSNSFGMECVACHWFICTCGACGCGNI